MYQQWLQTIGLICDGVGFAKTHACLFFAGVVAFLTGMVLQLAGSWPGCCAFIGIIPQSLG